VYTEDDLLSISALQHLLFCERRAALVYTEGIWEENTFTVEGRHLHERADETVTEVRGDLRVARSLRLRSLRLGLSGIADVVEFQRVSKGEPGITLESAGGLWRPMPVEYKRGRLRKEEGYEVQLCAQALCLEEMLEVEILAGALFYGKTRRRLEIAFNEKLRRDTEASAVRLHELLQSKVTPRAKQGPKCERCSLVDLCLPEALGRRRDVKGYLAKAIAEDADSS